MRLISILSRPPATIFLSTLMLLPTAPALAQHDCVPYTPTPASGNFDNNWSDSADHDVYQFTVPDDPAGGYVTVELTTTAPARPWLNVSYQQAGPAISSGGTTDANPQEITVVFEVAASQTYWLEVFEFQHPPEEDHPWPYQLSWTFTSRPDCYEPNDGVPNSWPAPTGTARLIPLEQVIEATSIAGHLGPGIAAGDAHNFDWYEIMLASSSEISIGTLQVPTDQAIKLRLWDSNGVVRLETGNPVVGRTIHAGPALLAPGSYYLETYPFVRGLGSVRTSPGQAVPSHFDRPYQLVVTTEPLGTGCGFYSVFCDDLETGDTTEWSSHVPP